MAIGRVAMNNAPFRCFIERRNQTANLFRIGLDRTANAFLQGAEPCPHTAVLISAGEGLPGTFRCGFGIGHGGVTENLRGVDARAGRQNVKMSILNQVRGPDATFI